MNKQEIVNEIKKTEQYQDWLTEEVYYNQNKISKCMETLKELKAELEKPESKVWMPKLREIYFIVDYSSGCVKQTVWDKFDLDDFRFNHNNCFRTIKEAEFTLEKYKVLTELEMFAKEKNEEEIDWEKEYQSKYYIYYCHFNKSLQINYSGSTESNNVYFSLKSFANKAIELFGDRMKKYVYEVKE